MTPTKRYGRATVWAALIALAFAALAGGNSTSWAQGQLVPTMPGREITVLLFPVNVDAADAPADTSRWATTALQAALDELAGVTCLDFSRSSPLVRRAVAEGRVRTVDVEQRVTDPRVAIAIGNAMGVNMVLLATVQSYKLTPEPAQVEVVLSGQIYDVQANFDPQTQEAKTDPQVFRALGVVGRSQPRARFQGPEGVLVREALRDAAFRAAQLAGGVPAEKIGVRPAPKKDKAWRWFILAAVVVGLAAAASSGTDGEPPPSPTPADYKPRNLVADVQPAGQNAIRVTWAPPVVTTNLLGYDLQFAVGLRGGAGPSGPYSAIAGGMLPPTATEYVHLNLDPTKVYYYRLRARYSDRQPQSGDWIYTGGVTFSSGG
ncbi:MAG: hypothetical protein N2512_01850 [Armatimonadetes bacterium]|nr:hypothetical protein [Armatimonadota bacterium]